jgi:N-dimethylarginine dimethylaminohydrolase
VDAAARQHAGFLDVLREHGIEEIRLSPEGGAERLFFPRDMAVVVGDLVIACNRRSGYRLASLRAAKALGRRFGFPLRTVDSGVLEGGDVLVDGNLVWAGCGPRSNRAGVRWLADCLAGRAEVQPLSLTARSVHLDLVFNILPGGAALVYPPAFEAAALKELGRRYELIEVNWFEQLLLGTNLLALSPQQVVVDARQRRLQSLLRDRGLEVLALDYSEVIKLGGSFRCSTCPIARDPITRP